MNRVDQSSKYYSYSNQPDLVTTLTLITTTRVVYK